MFTHSNRSMASNTINKFFVILILICTLQNYMGNKSNCFKTIFPAHQVPQITHILSFLNHSSFINAVIGWWSKSFGTFIWLRSLGIFCFNKPIDSCFLDLLKTFLLEATRIIVTSFSEDCNWVLDCKESSSLSKGWCNGIRNIFGGKALEGSVSFQK